MTRYKHNGLQTERLTVIPLTLSQVLMYLSTEPLLEKNLGLRYDTDLRPKEFREPIERFVVPYISRNPTKLMFGTIWIIVERQGGSIVGDIGLKGAPSDNGLVEIGYGTYPRFEGRGYMTEAVRAMIGWSLGQHDVRIILAETDKDNLASQHVLSKNYFSIFAESEFAYWWRLDKDKTTANEKIFN